MAPGEPAALAAALRQMIEHPEERRRFGLLGHAAVRERFDAPTMARATVAVYQKVLAG